jgi:hypothetical protein
MPFNEFADIKREEALIDSDEIKPLVADFDRVWGSQVSRRREILQTVKEMAS